MVKRAVFLLLLAVLVLVGQDRFTPRTVDTDPALVPASPTNVFTYTVYVEELTLTNKTAADVTCTVQDRQNTPRELFSGTVTAGSLFLMRFNGRKMPNGVTWSCSSGTAVIGYIQGVR